MLYTLHYAPNSAGIICQGLMHATMKCCHPASPVYYCNNKKSCEVVPNLIVDGKVVNRGEYVLDYGRSTILFHSAHLASFLLTVLVLCVRMLSSDEEFLLCSPFSHILFNVKIISWSQCSVSLFPVAV